MGTRHGHSGGALRGTRVESPYELESDGWHADEIHEAVCTWCEMGLFERSQEPCFGTC